MEWNVRMKQFVHDHCEKVSLVLFCKWTSKPLNKRDVLCWCMQLHAVNMRRSRDWRQTQLELKPYEREA